MNIQPVNFSQKRQQNFGMALGSNIVDRLLEKAGSDVKETKAVVELARKAALNQVVHVAADLRHNTWGSTLVTKDGWFPDSYIKGGSFENFAEQVERAERIAKSCAPVEKAPKSEIDTLREEARALAIKPPSFSDLQKL